MIRAGALCTGLFWVLVAFADHQFASPSDPSEPSLQSNEGRLEEMRRSLYPDSPPGREFGVETLFKVRYPVGMVQGVYQGRAGVFVSSLDYNTIFFVEFDSYAVHLVAGVHDKGGGADGSFAQATFSGPSRMCYDETFKFLYVGDKKSGHIRVLYMTSKWVLHVTNWRGTRIQFNYGVQNTGIFPGFDLQINGNFMYVTDTLKLYSITSDMGRGVKGRGNIPNAAEITEYASLTAYMLIQNYPQLQQQPSYVYSAAPDGARGLIYVSVSFAKNVVLAVPMAATKAADAGLIYVLIGDEDSTFEMCGECYSTPRAVNGFFGNDPADVKLTFPMHLKYSRLMDSLFIAESYPVLSDPSFYFGSQTIRRADLTKKILETYIGKDFSNTGDPSYRLYGTKGGNVDGPVATAQLAYPIAIDVSSYLDSSGFPIITIADLENSAVRFVGNRGVPTTSPTIFRSEAPTKTSQFVTQAPTTPSQFNTLAPTMDYKFLTSAPSTSSQFFTQAPSSPSQFITSAPTTSAQFLTQAPTLLDQFSTNAPTTNSQFGTSTPTKVSQFTTPVPTAVLVTSAPTAVLATDCPTKAAQFSTNVPTLAIQFSSPAPTTKEQFLTRAPSKDEQFLTQAPTKEDQFSTAAPSTFRTDAPTQPQQFTTEAPTLSLQFVTNAPTSARQFVTPSPTSQSQFYTQAPTLSEQFHSEAPTSSAGFSTSTPTLAVQFSTPAPSSAQQFFTNSPTEAEQFVTSTPTRTEQAATRTPTHDVQFHSQAPTAAQQFYTPAPTPDTQFVTNCPTTVAQFVTEAPSDAQQFSTEAPTIMLATSTPTLAMQFATSIPTLEVQFATEAPSSIQQFATQSPTLVEQLHSEAPTSALQFVTAAPTVLLATSIPTLAQQFLTPAPSQDDQFYTSAPSTAQQSVTEMPTRISLYNTRAPTLAEQFWTTMPTVVAQFSTPVPTFANPTARPTRLDLGGSESSGVGAASLLVLTTTSCLGGCCCCCLLYLLFLLCLAQRKQKDGWASLPESDSQHSIADLESAMALTLATCAGAGTDGDEDSVVSNPLVSSDKWSDNRQARPLPPACDSNAAEKNLASSVDPDTDFNYGSRNVDFFEISTGQNLIYLFLI